MSNQRIAVMAGVALSRGATVSPASPPPTHQARNREMPSPFNLLITSTVLSGVLVAVCAVCYCCGRTKPPRKPRVRARQQGVYSVPIECPRNAMYYDNEPYPSCRRPPTPGPPPAYDSVVSSNDKLRRFGIDDDNNEESDKFERYLVGGSLGSDELRDIVITCASPRKKYEILNYCNADRNFMKNGRCLANATDDSEIRRDADNDELSENNRSDAATLDDNTGTDDILENAQSTYDREAYETQCESNQSRKGILKNLLTICDNTMDNEIDEYLPSYDAAISK